MQFLFIYVIGLDTDKSLYFVLEGNFVDIRERKLKGRRVEAGGDWYCYHIVSAVVVGFDQTGRGATVRINCVSIIAFFSAAQQTISANASA